MSVPPASNLFTNFGKNLAFSGKVTEIESQNVVNSDIPGYRQIEVVSPFKPGGSIMMCTQTQTHPGHMNETGQSGFRTRTTPLDFRTLSGGGVSVQESILRANEAVHRNRQTVRMVKVFVDMLQTALKR